MTQLVSTEQIESLVEMQRHPSKHFGRFDSYADVAYILHSQMCKETIKDLRNCPYSIALDFLALELFIGRKKWPVESLDQPLTFGLDAGRLTYS